VLGRDANPGVKPTPSLLTVLPANGRSSSCPTSYHRALLRAPEAPSHRGGGNTAAPLPRRSQSLLTASFSAPRATCRSGCTRRPPANPRPYPSKKVASLSSTWRVMNSATSSASHGFRAFSSWVGAREDCFDGHLHSFRPPIQTASHHEYKTIHPEIQPWHPAKPPLRTGCFLPFASRTVGRSDRTSIEARASRLLKTLA
jgi:hypothetical protein